MGWWNQMCVRSVGAVQRWKSIFSGSATIPRLCGRGLMGNTLHYSFFTQDLHVWIIQSIKPSRRDGQGNRVVLFVVAAWCIWQSRNKVVFAEEACSVEGTLRRVNSLVMEIKSAMAKLPHLERSYTLCLVGWTFPPVGWAKCNVDGSCRQASGLWRDIP